MHTLQSYEYVNPTVIITTALTAAARRLPASEISLPRKATGLANDRSILISKKPGRQARVLTYASNFEITCGRYLPWLTYATDKPVPLTGPLKPYQAVMTAPPNLPSMNCFTSGE
ncbi:hypothetical protein R70241_05561 [Paraburkholderia saeva]|nr:hypothetical protein R70241_05561 [Paraburkholderia saeva]